MRFACVNLLLLVNGFMCPQETKFSAAPPISGDWPSKDYCNWNGCDGVIQGDEYCNEYEWHCTVGCGEGAQWCSGQPDSSICTQDDMHVIEQINRLHNKNQTAEARSVASQCDDILKGSIFPGSRVGSCLRTKGRFKPRDNDRATLALLEKISSSCILIKEEFTCGPICSGGTKKEACSTMVAHKNTLRKMMNPACTCTGEFGINGGSRVALASLVPFVVFVSFSVSVCPFWR